MTERRIAECTTSEELVRTLCDLIRFYNVRDGKSEFREDIMGLVDDVEQEIDGILTEEARVRMFGE